MQFRPACAGVLLLAASGCANLSPIGEPEFACEAAAVGGVCASPSQILLGQPGTPADPAARGDDRSAAAGGMGVSMSELRLAEGNPRATMATPSPPPVDSATIAPAQVIRIWVAPHQSENGALVVSGFVYGEIAPRAWNVGFAADNDMGQGRTFQPLRADVAGLPIGGPGIRR